MTSKISYCCDKHIHLSNKPKISPLYKNLVHTDWAHTYQWFFLLLSKLNNPMRIKVHTFIQEHIEGLRGKTISSTAFKVQVLITLTPLLLDLKKIPFKAITAHFHWAIDHQQKFDKDQTLLQQAKIVWAEVKQKKARIHS